MTIEISDLLIANIANSVLQYETEKSEADRQEKNLDTARRVGYSIGTIFGDVLAKWLTKQAPEQTETGIVSKEPNEDEPEQEEQE